MKTIKSTFYSYLHSSYLHCLRLTLFLLQLLTKMFYPNLFNLFLKKQNLVILKLNMSLGCLIFMVGV